MRSGPKRQLVLLIRRARPVGLVSEVCVPAETFGQAMNGCAALAAKPRHPFASTEHSIRELCRGPFSRGDRNYLEEFIDHWFSNESAERRSALATSIGA